jgi:hypothetical protein
MSLSLPHEQLTFLSVSSCPFLPVRISEFVFALLTRMILFPFLVHAPLGTACHLKRNKNPRFQRGLRLYTLGFWIRLFVIRWFSKHNLFGIRFSISIANSPDTNKTTSNSHQFCSCSGMGWMKYSNNLQK